MSKEGGRRWHASFLKAILLVVASSAICVHNELHATEVEWRDKPLELSYRPPLRISDELLHTIGVPASQAPLSFNTDVNSSSGRWVAEASRARQPEVKATASQQAVKKPVRKAPRERPRRIPGAEQHVLFERRFTLEPGFTYARFERAQINLSGFLALDAIFLGDISVDNVESDILTFDLLARWGLSKRLQVELAAPFLYRRSVFQAGGVGGDPAVESEEDVTLGPFELGDISAGLSYQLRPESTTSPDIVLSVRLKAPTGEDPFGIKLITDPSNDNLTFPAELPSGNGVWTLSTGLSFLRTTDPAILFANVALFYNFEERVSDLSSALGTKTPGKVRLGNSLQYGLGIAFALNERLTLSLSYTQRFVEKTRTKPSGGNSTSIIGSDANVATLNVGVTYAINDRRTLVTNLGVGLTDDAADVQLSVKYPITF